VPIKIEKYLLGEEMTRKLYPLAMIFAIFSLLMIANPSLAQDRNDDWDKVRILPETGHWNFPDYFLVTAREDVVLSWEIKCTQGGGCFGREAEFVYDYSLAAGETIRIGWGPQCYRWQFDPIDWEHGYIAEPYPEVCAQLTATPPVEETPTPVPPTATPTEDETPVTTPPVTPATPTPTEDETPVTTPPATPATPTPTEDETPVTTPPATPGTETPTPEATETETPTTPNQTPAETPRSQLIAVTGSDLGGPNSTLPRLIVSLGIVLLGLGIASLGTRKLRQ
jgi:hypothetical protein